MSIVILRKADLISNSASAIFKRGGVIVYLVMQVYVNLALEDKLKVGKMVLDRYSISCVCISTI